MEDDPIEAVKSFLLGIVLPAILVFFAVVHLTSHETMRTRGHVPLQPHQVLARGLFGLGAALIFHAWWLRAYENRPVVRFVLFVLGAILLMASFCAEVLVHT